jgi:antirestriction protein ArdC
MRDLYGEITRSIVAAIERGNVGRWRMPWHVSGDFAAPINAISRRPYRGVNVLALWSAADTAGYPRGEWATYAQWSSIGAQVRKGERSTTVVFWKFSNAGSSADEDSDDTENESGPAVLVRGFNLFNAAQVDNAPPELEPETTERERIEVADLFFNGIGANVRHGGNRAYYAPLEDRIQMPKYSAFDEPVLYYSTMAHEHVHWTAPQSRCDRELGKRFGDHAYAAEELVAELGAAFVCAHLGLNNAPREDHAQYLHSWLKVLKADSRAIFTATSQAQKACDFLTAKAMAEVDA